MYLSRIFFFIFIFFTFTFYKNQHREKLENNNETHKNPIKKLPREDHNLLEQPLTIPKIAVHISVNKNNAADGKTGSSATSSWESSIFAPFYQILGKKVHDFKAVTY